VILLTILGGTGVSRLTILRRNKRYLAKRSLSRRERVWRVTSILRSTLNWNQGAAMRGITAGVAVFLASAVGTARVANAQGAEFSLGAGASIPLSNFKDVAKTGYHGLVGISFAPSTFPLGIQIDGQYHRLKQKSTVGNRTNQIIMGTANLIYKFKTSEGSQFRPYLIAGGGIYNFRLVGGSDVAGPGVGNTGNKSTDFGLNAGAGFDIKAGGVGFFAEGRFHDVFDSGPNTKFIPITVGIRLGGN
jgi:hypothetical protein